MERMDLSALRSELVLHRHRWQFDLLGPDAFFQFANERRISVFSGEKVAALWRSCLLRADSVTSREPLDIPGLRLVRQEPNEYSYVDERPILPRAEGYGGVFLAQPTIDADIAFHPFRLYVLYHVERVFESMTASIQYLDKASGIVNLAELHVKHLNDWTSTENFCALFDRWNQLAELAIVLEPLAYADVYGTIRWRFPSTPQTLEAELDAMAEQFKPLVQAIGADVASRARESLVQAAEIMDGNRSLHVLLRLMPGRERLKLRSTLGACMHFSSMAEVIRRAFERLLNCELPEEDEIGFGQWMEGARNSLYGTDRIFDATRTVRRNYITVMGLDFGVKVRCYVEGETEFGALAAAVGDTGGIDFVNLRGQVAERRGKGLAFADSLKNDQALQIFSVVVLDEDCTDNVRALRAAATTGNFFGRFFISSPDFEFANFTSTELLQIALDLSERNAAAFPEGCEGYRALIATNSGKAFMQAFKKHGGEDISKSEAWGQALMRRAIAAPRLPSDHPSAGQERPVVTTAKMLINARQAGYAASASGAAVDPATGDIVASPAD